MDKKKRDFIEEIKSIKSRSEFNSRYDYSTRLNDIEYALKEFLDYNGSFNDEILKYIPISTIACFEAFFRSTVKEIVDFGKPYSENVANFNQARNIKLDFEVVAAIQTKSLTVGEFVAHILPYNNYEDICSNLRILLNLDFTSELKTYKKKTIFEDDENLSNDFQNRYVEIINSVKRTYELRHIFCHEFATNLKIDKNEILVNFNNCKLFLEQVNNFIWYTLYPNSPESQLDMNILAHRNFETKDKKLKELVKLIKTSVLEDDFDVDRFDGNLFDKCMSRWLAYRKLHAEYKASSVKGGSMYPLLYASDMELITEEKILSLENEFEMMLRKINYS